MEPEQQQITEIEWVLCLTFQTNHDPSKQLKPCEEIIEVNATAYNIHSLQQVQEKFHRIVKPTCNPKISQTVSQRTKLSTAQIKSGCSLDEAINKLGEWTEKLTFNQGSKHHGYTYAVWGQEPIKKHLYVELKQKKIVLPNFLHSYIDLKKLSHRLLKINTLEQCLTESQMVKFLMKQEKQISLHCSIELIFESIFFKQKIAFKPHLMIVLHDIVGVTVTKDIRYLCVLDFEATCEDNMKMQPCAQIIQFPVMVVDLESMKIINKFHHYVSPTFNPKLTKFCTELTGITQQMVDNKIELREALHEFDKWIDEQQYLFGKNWVFVTCGDWDLAVCLKKECREKQLQVPDYLKRYINIKKAYMQALPGSKGSRGMMNMLKELAIKHEGRHHSGIDDVLNICHICIQLTKHNNFNYNNKLISSVK